MGYASHSRSTRAKTSIEMEQARGTPGLELGVVNAAAGQHHVGTDMPGGLVSGELESDPADAADSSTLNITSAPHILFMLVDDMGWNDIGFQSTDLAGTDRLPQRTQR